MRKEMIQLPQMSLVGIKVRTNNKNEIDPATAKIGSMMQRYFQEQIAQQITERKNPNRTICVYTEYESDASGDYTYFIGEEVTAAAKVPNGLSSHTIPMQPYAKFTPSPGQMPGVVISAWQRIWKMEAAELGGIRAYHSDFEVYDERAADPANASLDIYIGVL